MLAGKQGPSHSLPSCSMLPPSWWLSQHVPAVFPLRIAYCMLLPCWLATSRRPFQMRSIKLHLPNTIACCLDAYVNGMRLDPIRHLLIVPDRAQQFGHQSSVHLFILRKYSKAKYSQYVARAGHGWTWQVRKIERLTATDDWETTGESLSEL